MKRAQIVEANQPLQLSETDIPEVSDGGLILKTKFTGICGSYPMQCSDVINMGGGVKVNMSHIFYKLPITPGHEIAGIVHLLGPNQPPDHQLNVGDRVAIYPCRGCGRCVYCKRDEPNKCSSRLGQNYGFGTPGGYASFVSILDSRQAFKLPDTIPLDVACMLGCAGLTSYGALDAVKSSLEEVTSLEGRASLLITSTGGLSWWCVQLAKAHLPSVTKVVVSSTSAERVGKFYPDSGCDDAVHWKSDMNEEDLVRITKTKGSEGGFDAVIDMVGTQRTTSIALQSLRPNGTLVLVGFTGGLANFSIPSLALWTNVIKGTLTGSRKQFEALIKLVAKHKITPPSMQFFVLDQANEALDLLKQGKVSGRCIIRFN